MSLKQLALFVVFVFAVVVLVHSIGSFIRGCQSTIVRENAASERAGAEQASP